MTTTPGETFEAMALRIGRTLVDPRNSPAQKYDFLSWGLGYIQDANGEYTIPRTPAVLTTFATRLRDEWMKGKVLVPKEPTEAMIEAVRVLKEKRLLALYNNESKSLGIVPGYVEEYRAMLAAAEKEQT